jgi:uncharacterized spore protein YtfJ
MSDPHHADPAAGPTRSADMVTALADRLGARVGAATVYGAPVERNGFTVIPVATSQYALGGGTGSDPGKGQEGGGAGGVGRVAPTGYIEVGEHGTRFVPIVRPERMVLLMLAGALGCAAMLGATRPGRRRARLRAPRTTASGRKLAIGPRR